MAQLSQKPVFKKEVIFLIALGLVWLMIPGCSLIDEFLATSEFKYQNDFENILSVVQKNGKGLYVMDSSQERNIHHRYIDENDERVWEKIPLTDDEWASMCAILSDNGDTYITNISVNDNYVMFYDERSGCGVMYTEDIESSIEIYNRDTDRFSYRWLSPGWYKIVD